MESENMGEILYCDGFLTVFPFIIFPILFILPTYHTDIPKNTVLILSLLYLNHFHSSLCSLKIYLELLIIPFKIQLSWFYLQFQPSSSHFIHQDVMLNVYWIQLAVRITILLFQTISCHIRPLLVIWFLTSMWQISVFQNTCCPLGK